MAAGSVNGGDDVWVNGNAVQVPSGQWPRGATPRALLRLAGPVLPAWRQRLAAEQLTVHFWCPPNGVCVQMPQRWQRQPSELARLSFVAGGCDYTGTMCQRFDTTNGRSVPQSPLPSSLVDLVCFTREDREAVAAELARRGIGVLESSTTKLRVAYESDLAELRDLPGVKLADRPRLPGLLAAAELRASVRKASGAVNPSKNIELDAAGLLPSFSSTAPFTGTTTNSDGQCKVTLRRPITAGFANPSRRTLTLRLGQLSKRFDLVI